jgi:hypothetical protein
MCPRCVGVVRDESAAGPAGIRADFVLQVLHGSSKPPKGAVAKHASRAGDRLGEFSRDGGAEVQLLFAPINWFRINQDP